MVMHGLETTVPVTLDMMILQGRAVMRGSKRALVVVDMPFGSYEESREQAFRNAARVLKETGAGAIKMEGGAHMAETVAFLVRRGVPVMGHVGLTPQAVNTMGGFRVQGRGEEGRSFSKRMRARSPRPAPSPSSWRASSSPSPAPSRSIAAPTIGIGASPACDGQILVLEDMLGLSPWTPKFVKKFGSLREHIEPPSPTTPRRFAPAAFRARSTSTRSPSADRPHGTSSTPCSSQRERRASSAPAWRQPRPTAPLLRRRSLASFRRKFRPGRQRIASAPGCACATFLDFEKAVADLEGQIQEL